MIVQCPSCHTAYRHGAPPAGGAQQAVQCGQCETEFPLARGKSYRVLTRLSRQSDPTLGIGLDDPTLAKPLAVAAAIEPPRSASPTLVPTPKAEVETPEQPDRDLPECDGRWHPLTTVSGLATIGAAAGYYGPTLTSASWPLLTGAGTGALLGLLGGWLWMRLSNRQN